MDGHNNNNNHKDFEDLLKRLGTNKTGDLDDFEREALEGFEILGSEEVSKKTKVELDKRIYNEVFTEENKRKPFAYWFAAAGLLLVIGLSVLFIKNNENVLPQKNVAIINEPKIQDESPASVMEEKAALPETVPVKEETKSVKNPGKDLDKRIVAKGTAMAPVQTSTEFPPEEEKPALVLNDERQKDKDQTNNLSTQNNQGAGPDLDAKEKKAAERSVIVTKTDKLAEQDIAFTADREESKKKTKSSKRYKSADVSSETMPSSVEKESEVNNTLTTGSAYANPTSPNSAPKNNEGKVADAKAEKADDANSPTNYVYYSGGEDGLVKELREKLTDKGLSKKFDAVLLINEKKKVERVNFLNVYDLTLDEQNKITGILKQLSKFNFYIQPNTTGLYEFKVVYRP